MAFFYQHQVLFTLLFLIYCVIIAARFDVLSSSENNEREKARLYNKGYFRWTAPVLSVLVALLGAGAISAQASVPVVRTEPAVSTHIQTAPPVPRLPAPVQLKDGHFVPVSR